MRSYLLFLLFPFFLHAQSQADLDYQFLDSTFSPTTELSQLKFAIEAFELYQLKYPDSPQEDEVLVRLSDLYKQVGNQPKAMYALLKCAIVHKNSSYYPQALQELDTLMTYSLNLNIKNRHLKVLQNVAGLAPNESGYRVRTRRFFAFIFQLDLAELDRFLLEDLTRFWIKTNGNSKKDDEILFWLGAVFKRQDDVQHAVLYFERLLRHFTSSEYYAVSLFELAMVYGMQNKTAQLAVDRLIELINQFPESPFTAEAQFQLGVIYEKRFSDKIEALTNYKLYVQAFPNHNRKSDALFRMAAIQVELDAHPEAINSLKMIVESARDEEKIRLAYKKIIALYKTKLKDWEQAAKTMVLYANLIQDSNVRAEELLNAGKIYKEKLKDRQQAHALFKIIIDTYPESSFAQQAKEELK